MNYRFSPLLKQEAMMAQKLHEALEGDILDQIMDMTGIMDNPDDTSMRNEMEVKRLRVQPDIMPRLYGLLENVRLRLGFKSEVQVFITNSKEVNACTYFSTTAGRPLIVNLNSALVEMMSEEELCFVVGHELGHQIAGNFKLEKLIRFVYPDLSMAPMLFQLKVLMWRQLCELEADRFGYLAVGDLNVCVSAFFKFHTGLNLEGIRINTDAFIEHNKQLLAHYTEGEFLSFESFDHPADSIRVEALSAFANAQTEEELENIMCRLIYAISRVSTNKVGEIMPYFIASAGLLIANADGNISKEEQEFILQKISEFDLFPQSVLEEVAEGNVGEFFGKSVEKILSLDPDMKPALMEFILDQVMSDNKLGADEVNLAIKLCVEALGYTAEEAMAAFAMRVRAVFRPSFGAICN